MSVLPTDASEYSSSLLPTPSAYESTPTDEFNEEVREHLLATHERLYLPGRKWHSQRTLSRMAGALLPTPVVSDGRGLTDGDSRDGGPSLREVDALLPTPGAWLGRRPENATADPERAASREHEGARGKRSLELPDALATLLPTPTTQDAANTAGPSQGERNTPPLNTVVTELLPTPSASDGSGGRIDNAETTRTGKRPSGAKAELTLRTALTHKMLPTPVANPDNPGAGGELRAALEHGPGRRNETGIDSMGRPNQGRTPTLPTPSATDARPGRTTYQTGYPTLQGALTGRRESELSRTTAGGHTSPRSGDGSASSGEPHPDQLTLGDA